MTTASDLIQLAMRDCGALGEGETPSAGETSDAFETLKQLLSLWQIDNLYIYAQVTSSFVPTGALSYTVGATGNVAITRPERIDYAFWRSGTSDLPITLLNSYEEYLSIYDKTMGSDPRYGFYLPSYPLGTLYLYPQPSTGTVHITRQERLPTLTAVTDTLTLPPEYVLPFRYTLAEMLGLVFQAPIPPRLSQMAALFRATLKRNNLRITELVMPVGIPTRYRGYILTGE